MLDNILQKEKYHTLLAVLYLEAVLRYLKQNGPSTEASKLRQARSAPFNVAISCSFQMKDIALTNSFGFCPREQLQHLLSTSSVYRVQLLLGRALENNLYEECAILYGKVGCCVRILALRNGKVLLIFCTPLSLMGILGTPKGYHDCPYYRAVKDLGVKSLLPS